MTHRETVQILARHRELTADLDLDSEAKKWDWASASQVEAWLEEAGCSRGDVARALRNVGCTPRTCSRTVLADGKSCLIGLLAAEGAITIQEARRLALSTADRAILRPK